LLEDVRVNRKNLFGIDINIFSGSLAIFEKPSLSHYLKKASISLKMFVG
jgi:hypothetical protein